MVKAQWFELVTQSPRVYKLQAEERCVQCESNPKSLNLVVFGEQPKYPLCPLCPRCRTLVVNEMIRLVGLKFDKTVKHSKRLGGGAAECTSMHYFGEDSHNCLEALVRDQKAESARVRNISAEVAS